MGLSSLHRQSIVEKFKNTHFDLLVIGGGITGAGIALDASARGLKTALVEKSDFAFGTSSRSTKLIHGGLRYLKQFEFGLVKEVGSERAVVHQLAPHLVVPEKMLLPLHEKRGFGSLLTSFGLKLYDFLAGVKPEDQRRMLTKNQTLHQEPLLRKDDIKGGAIYAEYRTDDARLTMEIIKSAALHGSEVINYCRVLKFIYEDGKIVGARIKEELSGEEFEIKSRAIINAAGPWVDELRELDKSKLGKRLQLTKGVHLVVSREKLPIRQAIYFDVEEDSRMIFCIPRGRATYIGTTDTNYEGSKEEVVATSEDATYLILAVNQTFPGVNLTLNDIESSWAGLRPLIYEDGKSASELSRKDEIFESPSGLLSIAGGKLTGYRKMAERVLDQLIDRTFPERELEKCETHKIRLFGSDFKNYREVKQYIASIEALLKKNQLPDEYANYLVGNYGKQTDIILNDIQSGEADIELAKAELRFAIHHEMAVTPLDFFIRRTGMLYFDKPRMMRVSNAVLLEFKMLAGWDQIQYDIENKSVESSISGVTSFK